MKSLVNSVIGGILSALTVLASVELSLFVFLLFEKLLDDPLLSDIVPLVWLLQSGLMG